ncbi:MAG: succinate dehydrogenase [Planctomycetota bacterium]|jgi:hypothetical protein|nr:succinate dehydrogenase [Planctomycetota bacterium]
MPSVELPVQQKSFAETSRRDAWWVAPVLTFIGLLTFIVYATWAAFQGEHYHHGNYLSPFYSPEIFGKSPHNLFGPVGAWWPSILPYSPAFLILWAPAGFRFTCYYYRGAYYKAFWADPPTCSVGEPRKTYLGENSLPLILQNAHRYFLYFAIVIVMFLAHDAWKAMWFDDGNGGVTFGIGLGTIILTVNTYLLAGYTLGCHSFRHLIGGFRNFLSKSPIQLKAYKCVSCLNSRHMIWAWCSLFSVGFSDVYVRLCSMGIWTDWRII